MEIIGYFMAIAIGVTLGLIGGGGSILAVPVLAYLFGMDEKVATAYSLFIVGTAALVGGLRQHRNGNVDWRTSVVLASRPSPGCGPCGITSFRRCPMCCLRLAASNSPGAWAYSVCLPC